MKKRYVILISLVCLIAGFYAGRQAVSTTVEYSEVKLKPVTGVSNLSLMSEKMPVIPMLPMKPDTVWMKMKVDTAAIIADWITEREYASTLFDNQYGKLNLSLTSQYNKLSGLSYVFTPIQQVRTIERLKVWQPFVFGSYNSFRNIGIGAGIFYHDLGISIKYLNDFSSKSGWEVSTYYKF